jgi:hypothetical protein
MLESRYGGKWDHTYPNQVYSRGRAYAIIDRKHLSSKLAPQLVALPPRLKYSEVKYFPSTRLGMPTLGYTNLMPTGTFRGDLLSTGYEWGNARPPTIQMGLLVFLFDSIKEYLWDKQ